MREDFITIHINVTVDQAIATIRQNPPRSRVIYFYVVDDDNRLQGVLPTRRMFALAGEVDSDDPSTCPAI